MCDLLASMDNKIIQVALDGLENILRVGQADRGDPPEPGVVNKYAIFIEEANGVEKIHQCQHNENQEIYLKSYHIIETYSSSAFLYLMCSVTLVMKRMLSTRLSLRNNRRVNLPSGAQSISQPNNSILQRTSTCPDSPVFSRVVTPATSFSFSVCLFTLFPVTRYNYHLFSIPSTYDNGFLAYVSRACVCR